jgi:hypothetical protein
MKPLFAILLLVVGMVGVFSQPAQFRVRYYQTLTNLLESPPAGNDRVAIIVGVAAASSRDGYPVVYDPSATNTSDWVTVFTPTNGVGRVFKLTGSGLSAPINATNISSGAVSNSEFTYLDGLTNGIQTQLDGKQPTGNYITALTGDGTATGPGSVALTLASTSVTNGVYGSTSHLPQFSVDAKGRVTGVTNVAFANPTSSYFPYNNGGVFADSTLQYQATNSLNFNRSTNFIRTISGTGNANASIAIGKGSLEAMNSGLSRNNLGVGQNALQSLTTGEADAFGLEALNKLTTGVNNVGIGHYAGYSTTTGSRVVAIGDSSAYYNVLGSDYVAIGSSAGAAATNINRSVMIGSQPYVAGSRTSRTVTDSVIIGSRSQSITNDATSVTNSIYIGAGLDPTLSNAVMLGTNGVTVLYLNGTVGWFRGTGSPEGSVAAPVGSFYTREDGGTDTAFYRKESGSGNTGWVASATATSGPTINSTDGVIPVRGDGSTFTNSPFRVLDRTVYTGGSGAIDYWGSTDGIILYGTNNQRDFVTATLNGPLESLGWLTSSLDEARLNIDQRGNGHHEINLRAATNYAVITIDDDSSRGLVLDPFGGGFGNAPFELSDRSGAVSGSSSFLVKSNSTTIFDIKNNSGYGGAGTNLFVDNGTYKTVGAALGTNSATSAQLASGLTDETGSGLAVFSGAPTITNLVVSERVGTSGLTINGATQTASNPAMNISQTWNNANRGFVGASISVTDSGSTNASALAEFLYTTNSVTYTNVSFAKNGDITIRGVSTSLSPIMYFENSDSTALSGTIACSQNGMVIGGNHTGIKGNLYLGSSGTVTYGSVILVQEAAAILQLGIDAATTTTQTVKSHDGSGTDKDGAKFQLRGGQSTGTGRGGDIAIATSLTSTTGSTANSYSTRQYDSAKPVTLTDTTATTFANIGVLTNTIAGATIVCTVYANDATDYQALTSTLNVNAVNKNGTITTTITQVDGTTAASSGTLTCTYTSVVNGNTIDIKANATSSLTETTLACKWSITALNGTGTTIVTAQ